MKWPFVTERSLSEALHRAYPRSDALVDEVREALRLERARYQELLTHFVALRVQGANAPLPVPATVVFDEPEQPPDVVLAAMQQISPVRDRTYEANWAHWERNKAKAKTNPDAFAQEILEGAEVDWTVQTR